MTTPLIRAGCTLVLDVSSEQPADYDFARAAELGVRGVIAKTSQGQGSPDTLFLTHTRRAAEAVEIVGSYHVLEAHWDDMRVQAEEYFRLARDVSMLGPIVDVERTKNSSSVPLELVAQQTLRFVEASSALWSHVGKPAGVVYSGLDYFLGMCKTKPGLAAMRGVLAAGWKFWLAAYRAEPPTTLLTLLNTGDVVGWQWTGGEIRIGGVPSDLSWFTGDEKALAALGVAQ